MYSTYVQTYAHMITIILYVQDSVTSSIKSTNSIILYTNTYSTHRNTSNNVILAYQGRRNPTSAGEAMVYHYPH